MNHSAIGIQDYCSLDRNLDFDLRSPLVFARGFWVLIEGLVEARTYTLWRVMFTFLLIYSDIRGSDQRNHKEIP